MEPRIVDEEVGTPGSREQGREGCSNESSTPPYGMRFIYIYVQQG